jgi:hypothetical protein
MATACITLEDDAGAVACKLVFSGGFDRSSGAHQAAQILIKTMDDLMDRLGAAVIDPVLIEHSRRDLELRTPGEQVVANLTAIRELSTVQVRSV